MTATPRNTDYATYQQVALDLHLPICETGLDPETVKKLYESKWSYLESLRIRCFMEINRRESDSPFSLDDYLQIVEAQKKTVLHMRELIRSAFFAAAQI